MVEAGQDTSKLEALLELVKKINAIDGAFIESISYTEWIQVLLKSKQKIKEKLKSVSRIKSDLK